MTTSPLQDVVSKQYEEWVYPAPIQDLTSWVGDNWQWFDPSHAHSVLWPEREQKLDLDILIAGCGTNQAAVFAYTNPDAKITAIDVSQTSLDHTEYLKKRHGLDNLEVLRLPIEEAGTLGKTFDLIVSTGVLHHLADPQAEMMQDIFRELGLGQSSYSIAKVREAIAATPANHPVRSYLAIAPDLDFDAGAVDTFLHGRDCDYTVAQCIELVEQGGLAFQDMFLRTVYHPPLDSEGSSFFRAVEELPREKIWGAMERINFANACHFFLATHPNRPANNYVIDFSTTDCFRYVPSFRYRCGLNGSVVYRNNWSLNLNDAETAILRLIDGKRTIGDILAEITPRKKELGIDVNRVEMERLIRRLFQGLWRNDYITVSTAGE